MSNCDFSNLFNNAELFKGIKPYLDEFNTDIEQATQAHHGKVVPLYLTLNGPNGNQNPVGYLQADQCHLNPKGHQKVADMLRALGYEK
jgi:lysophospholipase L1-like esterase